MSDANPRAGADAAAVAGQGDVVTKLSSRSVAETASLFTNLLASKGLKIFSVIDQGAEAGWLGCSCARRSW
jgi:hypothetical protein